jgi:hypothetical protein
MPDLNLPWLEALVLTRESITNEIKSGKSWENYQKTLSSQQPLAGDLQDRLLGHSSPLACVMTTRTSNSMMESASAGPSSFAVLA